MINVNQASPDPITLAVLSARLSAIVEEIGEALLRTAYSQILNASRDFSAAICDHRGRLVAQADHIPVHVGALPFTVVAVRETFGEAIHRGDIFLLNDPWHGGSHLPDMTILVPVFAPDITTPLFWTVVRAHHSDIGGATHGAYNPAATEIWQEGIRIPPIRLGEGGVPRPDLLAMLSANSRLPREFRGDMLAQIGAARLGEVRLTETIASYGAPALLAALEHILDLAEQQARRAVASWPDGLWQGEAVLDDDGNGAETISIRATVTKQGSSIIVDLSASDDQVRGFVNSSYPNMRSAVAMAFAYLIDPDIPKNDGAFRALSVIAREGSIVWAREGAAVTMCTSHCSNQIVEAIMCALANCCPDRVMGGWGRRFRIAIAGRDPRRDRPFVWHMFHARPGGGASAAGDGWPGGGEWESVGGLKFSSIEMAEARFPLFFPYHEFRPDSGGAGVFAGGDGGIVGIEVQTADPARINTAGDGVRHGARGMAGGTDGAPHHYVLQHLDGSERVLRTKESGIVVQPGETIKVQSGGGGGWGVAS
jgi:N-methylhydantoinase B